jgi:pyruvate kinase
MRRTKIVATLGPASTAPATLDALIAAGVDVFRLNFSHGTHESHGQVFAAVREAASRAARHVAILQDLSGPKIRTGTLAGGQPLELCEGDELRVAVGEGPGSPGTIFTTYAPLIVSAEPGDRLLLDDGKIELFVKAKTDDALVTEVVDGGPLGEHKGINAPGVALPGGALTTKDEADLKFGLQLGVDLVALSFVQTPEDCHAAKRIMRAAGIDVPIIAKIERPQALDHLDEIVEASDGVMVARGDLGLECPLERVPRIQKTIVASARAHGKPVIVATQVLESMRTEPRPTRAEVSDAANSVDEGVDAIMLAGETAAGRYPVQAVETLREIIRDAETLAQPAVLMPTLFDEPQFLHGRAMCEAAVTLASTGQAEAIVALTKQGKTAELLSALRPRTSILTVTPSDVVARRLKLYWGVRPLVSDLDDIRALEAPLRRAADLSPRAVVVFINVSPDLGREDANFLNVQRLGD